MSHGGYNLKVERIQQSQFAPMKIPVRVALPYTIFGPNKKDLRPQMPPVYDQGELASCTANALVAALQYRAPTFMGSRLFLYYNERAIEGTIHEDGGATMVSGIVCMKRYGVCSEKSWPYIPSKLTVAPPRSCYIEALSNRVLTAYNIRNTMSVMKAALNAGYPFVVGIQVFDAFESYAVATTGIVPMPPRNAVPLGGHAVLVCGYDEVRKWWIVRNSWGASWGDKGYFYLPYAYLLDSRLTSDLWYIASAAVKALPPAPPTRPPAPVRSKLPVPFLNTFLRR
jgi:C1A family cysteine protease